ncbi:MAG: hypothetical protein JWP17_898 [Solirubrobacterales bacterium]|jgi:hypothetical protein|nr:hypothetical protein [Solirubrobacterales bacterium]
MPSPSSSTYGRDSPRTMATDQPDITALFAPLDGQLYASYVDLDAAVRQRFRAERRFFPSAFTYRDAIAWASEAGVVTVREGRLVVAAVAQPV